MTCEDIISIVIIPNVIFTILKIILECRHFAAIIANYKFQYYLINLYFHHLRSVLFSNQVFQSEGWVH
jgi:hypothetical protein